MHSHFPHLSDAELLHFLRGVYFRRAESTTYVAIAAILITLAAVSIRSPIPGIFFLSASRNFGKTCSSPLLSIEE